MNCSCGDAGTQPTSHDNSVLVKVVKYLELPIFLLTNQLQRQDVMINGCLVSNFRFFQISVRFSFHGLFTVVNPPEVTDREPSQLFPPSVFLLSVSDLPVITSPPSGNVK